MSFLIGPLRWLTEQKNPKFLRSLQTAQRDITNLAIICTCVTLYHVAVFARLRLEMSHVLWGKWTADHNFLFFFQFKTSPLEFVSRKIDIISNCWTSLNKRMNKVFYANLMKVTNIKFHVMYSDPKFDKKKKMLFILYCNFHWLVGWCWWITKETVSCGRSFLTITVFKKRVSQMTTGGNLKLVRLW